MQKDYVPAQDTFSLPSNGAWYDIKDVTLRMKTTLEVKKGHVSVGPRTEPDIIQSCIVKPDNVNIYDLVIFDSTYLMHKLRVLTWGQMLPQVFVCPLCGDIHEEDLDLNRLEVNEVPEGFTLDNLQLPLTGSTITFRFLTLEDVIKCQVDGQKRQRDYPDAEEDFVNSYIVERHIESVDGKVLVGAELTAWLNKLPARDYLLIEAYCDKIGTMFGVSDKVEVECKKCKNVYEHYIQLTENFFRPAL